MNKRYNSTRTGAPEHQPDARLTLAATFWRSGGPAHTPSHIIAQHIAHRTSVQPGARLKVEGGGGGEHVVDEGQVAWLGLGLGLALGSKLGLG